MARLLQHPDRATGAHTTVPPADQAETSAYAWIEKGNRLMKMGRLDERSIALIRPWELSRPGKVLARLTHKGTASRSRADSKKR